MPRHPGRSSRGERSRRAAGAAPLAAALAAALALASAPAAHADDAPDLHVVLARPGPAALVLWNATPLVTALVTSHASDAAANDALERTALRAVAIELPALRNAKTIAVRILYDKTGAVSPVYGNATFAGVERYAELRLDGPKARRDAEHWRTLRATAPVPTWISYRVLGTLPPR